VIKETSVASVQSFAVTCDFQPFEPLLVKFLNYSCDNYVH